MLKYQIYNIVFQEIPDEVTFAVFLSNCPNHCPGCHSPHLWNDEGIELSINQIQKWMDQYKTGISCFCFMGGDSDSETVQEMAAFIKNNYGNSIKTAWFSGKNNLPDCFCPEYFDFIKIGAYDSSKGGLDSLATNQILYKIESKKFENINSLFHSRKLTS
jgi:anaerobic ribonucleoside-triphosphate reductase activating protein